MTGGAKRLTGKWRAERNPPVASNSSLPANEDWQQSPIAPLPATQGQLPAILPATGGTVASNAAIADSKQSPIASNSSVSGSAQKGKRPSELVPKVTVRIPEHLLDGLRLFMFARNESFQGAVLLAISELLATEGLLAIDDCCQVNQMIDDKSDTEEVSTSSVVTAQEALSYYEKHTGNEIREGDRQTARAVSGLPLVAIKTGIQLSIQRSKKRIHSLKYCLGAIHEASTEPKLSAGFLRYLESRRDRKTDSRMVSE